MQKPIPGLHLSDYRYWKVDGILDSAFSASAIIYYDGRSSILYGELDNTLITHAEDSLLLMYRPDTHSDWVRDTDVVQNFLGTKVDKYGDFTINHLKKGEYTLAYFDHSYPDTLTTLIADSCQSISGINRVYNSSINFQVYPNPTNGIITVKGVENKSGKLTIQLYNVLGQMIYSTSPMVINSYFETSIDLSNKPAGTYFVKLITGGYPVVKKIELE